MSKFDLGTVVATSGALAVCDEEGCDPLEFIRRHASGEWGDLCEEDQKANETALKDGSRIFSAYHSPQGVKLYVITEWDRSYTTLLRSDEY